MRDIHHKLQKFNHLSKGSENLKEISRSIFPNQFYIKVAHFQPHSLQRLEMLPP